MYKILSFQIIIQFLNIKKEMPDIVDNDEFFLRVKSKRSWTSSWRV